MKNDINQLMSECRQRLVKINRKREYGVPVSAEEIVLHTINNSRPKQQPYLTKVLKTEIKGSDFNTVITASVELFDGSSAVYELIIDPAFGGWGYMCKSKSPALRFGRPSGWPPRKREYAA